MKCALGCAQVTHNIYLKVQCIKTELVVKVYSMKSMYSTSVYVVLVPWLHSDTFLSSTSICTVLDTSTYTLYCGIFIPLKLLEC